MSTSIAEIQEITAQNAVSIKELRSVMGELAIAQKETERAQQETARVLQDTERALQETERILQENSQKTELALQELRKTVDEMSRKVDDTTVSVKEMSIRVDRTSSQMGGIGNRMGEIAEMILLPGLVQKMNQYHDHKFTKISHRNRYKKPGGGNFAEIDLELRNGEEIMFVEVKSDVSNKSVNTFIDRITTLRQNETVTELAGKTIFAAIAGIHFNNEARDIVAKYGMYLIEVNDDYESDKLVVIPPPDDSIGTW